jgi:uncharacterized membrane protein YedE/YeeE
MAQRNERMVKIVAWAVVLAMVLALIAAIVPAVTS